MLIVALALLGCVVLVFCAIIIAGLCKSNKKQAPAYSYINGEIKELTETTAVIHYTIADKTYRLQETLTMKDEAIKVGEVTVGHKQIPAVKAYRGQQVIIAYDPKDHAKAFWVANHE